ncbi:MAG TPA: FecR domain-containing protein [Polyangiaceae bacterium]|nr:FecR domain-containing protein [Polyangiaceae bacterium]
MRAGFGAGLCAWFAVACSSPVPLATLRQKSGSVERDWAAQLRVWKVAELGTTFHLGDGLQTHAGASAQLALDDGSQLSLDAETQVRFSDTPPEKHALGFDVETGAASLQAAAEPIAIHTRVGLARIDPGATVVFSHSNEGTRIVVEVGRAVFGEAEPLTAGAGVSVLPGGEVKRLDKGTQAALSSTAQPQPAEPPGDAAPDGTEITARVRGRGASVRTEQGWSALAEGPARLQPGTQLRLARKTSVDLEHGRERAQLQTGQYVIAPRAGVLVEASEGSLAAGSEVVVRIAVPGGEIVVAPAGLVNVSLGSAGTLLDVKAQQASVESNGEAQQIRAGQRATLTRSGELSVQGRGLEHADVEIEAGESLTIHDPAPPTAVRFRFAGVCPELGVLQLRAGRSGQYAVGEGAVSLSLGRGTQRYELRCGTEGGKLVKQGKLSVLSDDGSRRVAARAPATTLAADGHRYTVLYQNRLPVITLTWPDGPTGTALELTHSFAGKEEKIATREPLHVFESGTLREGRHDFAFTGGGKLSRHTRVDIQFDNAAPTATLDPPPPHALEPGDALTISGIALPGWQVQVGQQRAPQDDQGRFSLPTNWPSDTGAIAVRLSHPERGTHLYVRRPAPSARAGRSP